MSGVLSSCDTLATKSRRTLSSRRNGVRSRTTSSSDPSWRRVATASSARSVAPRRRSSRRRWPPVGARLGGEVDQLRQAAPRVERARRAAAARHGPGRGRAPRWRARPRPRGRAGPRRRSWRRASPRAGRARRRRAPSVSRRPSAMRFTMRATAVSSSSPSSEARAARSPAASRRDTSSNARRRRDSGRVRHSRKPDAGRERGDGEPPQQRERAAHVPARRGHGQRHAHDGAGRPGQRARHVQVLDAEGGALAHVAAEAERPRRAGRPRPRAARRGSAGVAGCRAGPRCRPSTVPSSAMTVMRRPSARPFRSAHASSVRRSWAAIAATGAWLASSAVTVARSSSRRGEDRGALGAPDVERERGEDEREDEPEDRDQAPGDGAHGREHDASAPRACSRCR